MYNVPTAERNTDKKFPQNFGLMMAKNFMFKQIWKSLLVIMISPGRCILKMIWLTGFLWFFEEKKTTLDQLIVNCRADRREKVKYMQLTRTTSLAGYSPGRSCRGSDGSFLFSRRKFFSIKILRHKVGQLAQPSESLEFVQFRPRQCLGESEGGREAPSDFWFEKIHKVGSEVRSRAGKLVVLLWS